MHDELPLATHRLQMREYLIFLGIDQWLHGNAHLANLLGQYRIRLAEDAFLTI